MYKREFFSVSNDLFKMTIEDDPKRFRLRRSSNEKHAERRDWCFSPTALAIINLRNLKD